MKPVSIIFCIISVILIVAGLITCSVGLVQAKAQGIQLYDTKDENDEIVNTYDFSADDIGKIEINAGDADVKIVCGADSNKIEIKNYSSTKYLCQVENKSLIMQAGMNILSLTDLAQGEIAFKGFRYYVNDFFSGKTLGRKSVTVYVTDTFDIKVFDINVGNGDVEIVDSNCDADYTVNVESGDILLKNIETSSNVTLKINKSGDVKLENVIAKSVNAYASEGEFEGEVSANEIFVEAGKDVTLACADDLEKYNYDLESPLGKISLLGIQHELHHKAYNPNLLNKIDICAFDGDITITASEKNSAE